MSNFRNRRLVTDAAAAKKYMLTMRLLRGIVSTILVLLFAGYVSVSLYKKFGSLTISINKYNSAEYSLILSETRTFERPSATIAAKETPDITNIAEADLPADLDHIDGQHNGPNYFAYTFYLMNNGENTLTYRYQITLSDIRRMWIKPFVFVYTSMETIPHMPEFVRTDRGCPRKGRRRF